MVGQTQQVSGSVMPNDYKWWDTAVSGFLGTHSHLGHDNATGGPDALHYEAYTRQSAGAYLGLGRL